MSFYRQLYTAPAVIFHATSALCMAYGFNSLSSLAINAWIEGQKGGHYQFLTVQGLVVALITMIVSLANDVVPPSNVLRGIKRAISMISLPLSIIISIIYWTLIAFYPALILQLDDGHVNSTLPSSSPKVPAPFRLPLALDLCLHLVPALSGIVDFMFFERKYCFKESRYAPVVIGLAAVWYGWWVEHCGHYNGVFPYPFLTNNPFDIRIRIYLATASLALVSFWVINALNSRH